MRYGLTRKQLAAWRGLARRGKLAVPSLAQPEPEPVIDGSGPEPARTRDTNVRHDDPRPRPDLLGPADGSASAPWGAGISLPNQTDTIAHRASATTISNIPRRVSSSSPWIPGRSHAVAGVRSVVVGASCRLIAPSVGLVGPRPHLLRVVPSPAES